MRHLLTGLETDKEGYLSLLSLARKMKEGSEDFSTVLKGKSAALLFEKPSLRTRTTFELAMFRLGGHAVYLDLGKGELGGRESVADYACNLSRWTDCLVARVYRQDTLEKLAAAGSVPVVNALSDLYHPAQAMADYLTVLEHLGRVEKVKLAYLGEGNNVTHSLLIAGAILGADVTCFCPLNRGPDVQIFEKARSLAAVSGGSVAVTHDVSQLKNFDVLYTDTWVSMGDDTPLEKVRALYAPYQINQELVESSGAQIVMHCLPAHRGFEITDEVMDGSKSVVFDEAENRLYIHMALLAQLLNP